MRRFVLALAAMMMLASCATLQHAYDDRAREDCEEENRDIERVMC
jgi:hypothetical protein